MKIKEVRQVFTGQQLDEKAKAMKQAKPKMMERDIVESDDAIRAHEKAGRRVVKHSDGSYTYYDDKEKIARKVKAGGKGLESAKYVPAGKDEDDPDYDEHGEKPGSEKRGRGRPKGSGKKLGAKSTGTSKLARGKAIKESLDDIMRLAGVREYTVEADEDMSPDDDLAYRMAEKMYKGWVIANRGDINLGDNAVDEIADELGELFDEVQASDDYGLKQVYSSVRQMKTQDPKDQAEILAQAIHDLGFEISDFNVEEDNQNWRTTMQDLDRDHNMSNISSGDRLRAQARGEEVPPPRTGPAKDQIPAFMRKAKANEEVENIQGLGQILESVLDDSDDSGFMAKSNLYQLIKNAVKLHELIGDRDQLEGWVEEKITLATDYINTVRDYVEYNQVAGVAEPEMSPEMEPETPEPMTKTMIAPETKTNPIMDNELADLVTLATRRIR